MGILKTFATGEHVQNLQNKLILAGKTAFMLQNVSVSNCSVNAKILMAADSNWGQYGHSTHTKRQKGGNKGKVVLKMNWTYELEDGRIGTVKFMGNTEFAKGNWVGLELAEGFKGKHNGTVEGTKYFAVQKKGQGVMVKANKIKKRVYSICVCTAFTGMVTADDEHGIGRIEKR